MINNKVSIIMNCHNGEKYLKESLDSLFKQTYKNWELIFLDNDSTDNSKKIINKFKDKRIKYFYTKLINLGVARKKAVNLCTGEFLIFFDVDDIWIKDKLEKQVNCLKKNKDATVCFSNSIFFNKNKRRLLYKKKPPDGFIFYNLLKKYYISLDTVLFSKKTFKELNHHIDEKFDLIHDMDLVIRLSKKNKFIYLNRPLSYWRVHEQSFSANKLSNINKEKEILLKKLISLETAKLLKKEIYELFFENILKTRIKEYIVNDKKKIGIKYLLNIKPFKIFYFFYILILLTPFLDKFLKKKLI
jgi:glycosyltransferase involved in cell wall biosynthesis